MPPSLCINLSADEQVRLLEIARQSIRVGLETGNELQLGDTDVVDNFRIEAAVFVTLTRRGELRGCIGSLQPTCPLAQAVANSAFGAAFRDRRFGKLQPVDLDQIQIEISVLSAMESIEVDSKQTLLDILQPGVDGLLMEDRGYRSTFLPRVWEKIPSSQAFLEQLIIKAGLPAGHWSSTIRFQRYHTLSFCEN